MEKNKIPKKTNQFYNAEIEILQMYSSLYQMKNCGIFCFLRNKFKNKTPREQIEIDM